MNPSAGVGDYFGGHLKSGSPPAARGYPPAVRPRDHDAITDASRVVIALVRSACNSWRFRSNLNHAVATSAMARAADLLEEALFLADDHPSPGANILVRSAFECWLVGAFALFGGDDALIRIEVERRRNEWNLADKNNASTHTLAFLDEQRADLAVLALKLLGTEKPEGVDFQKIAQELQPLIKDQTPDHEEADISAAYDLLYRSHSTYDAHPWKVLGQYLTESALGLKVVPAVPWIDPVQSVAHMAMYLANLGRWIDCARGRDGEAWSEATTRLVDLLRHA